MKSKFIYKPLLVLLALTGLFTACTDDDWQNHYFGEVSQKSDSTIMQYIESQPELSKFAQMIEIAGYDSLLNLNQTFTVWAPDNNALADIDLSNVDMVAKIVKNHITRFSLPTAGVTTKEVLMMNDKILIFSKSGNGYVLQDKTISTPNISLKNGVVHKMNQYVPYIYNVWEYIYQAEGIDSLRNYVLSLNKLEFDEEKSYLDGILIDSVFTETNRLKTILGKFDNEDYTYTALLPNNNAWNEQYAKILNYYKTLEVDGGSAAQISNTKWVLVRDLFFKGLIASPIAQDTLMSTYGTGFTNPAELFADAQLYANSNGATYITNSLKFKTIEALLKPIVIEAESSLYGRTARNYELTNYSSYGTGYDISNRFYLNAKATSTLSTAQLTINFPIPNTLSAKYNVYCVFVPNYITDTLNVKPYKIKFSVNTDYDDTKLGRDSVWASADNNAVTVANQAGTFITDPKQITKMLVLKNYSFPYANLYSPYNQRDMVYGDKIRVGLRVINAAGTTVMEKINFSRDIRIDYILLEPVIE